MTGAVLHVRVPQAGHLAGVVGDVVRLPALGSSLDHIRELRDFLENFDLLRECQRRRIHRRRVRHRHTLLPRLPLDAVRAGVSVLNVVGGILLPVGLFGEVEVEVEVGLCLPLDHEETEYVASDIGEKLVDGDVGRSARRLLHLLARARQRHELVHQQFDSVLRHTQGLCRCAHVGKLVDVVRALHVDYPLETAPELLAVIGNIR